MTGGIAHFTITGEWLTEHVRERVQSDMEDSALTLLTECLDGMTWEIAIAILRGEKRLVGDSGTPEGVTLDDELPEVRAAWEDVLRFRYGSAVELPLPDGSTRRGWFKPAGYVTDVGPADVEGGRMASRHRGESHAEWKRRKAVWFHSRIAHYALAGEVPMSAADGPGTDAGERRYPVVDRRGVSLDLTPRAEKVSGALGFLFAPCAPVPVWARSYAKKTPSEALATHGSVLEARGYSIWYADEIARRVAEAERARSDEGQKAARERELAEKARADEEREREREAAYQRALGELFQKIRAQAGDDPAAWVEIPVAGPDGKPCGEPARVARGAFEHYALWRPGALHLAHPWEPVAGSGWKMMNDDAYHTDVLASAGIDPGLGYIERHYDVRAWAALPGDRRRAAAVQKSIEDAAYEFQRKRLHFTAAVLYAGRGGVRRGKVVHPGPNETVPPGSIAVIPAASVDYVLAARDAAAIVTEAGGALAHLIVVSNEESRATPIVRVKDARTLYPVGHTVEVDAARGAVYIVDRRICKD